MNLTDERILVTGCAGFIGFHVAQRALAAGGQVVGIDNLCEEYYPKRLKDIRLKRLLGHPRFHYWQHDLAGGMPGALTGQSFSYVVHLAAHGCVMHSFDRPHEYIRTNITGTQYVFDFAKELPGLKHLVYASSSSVYGTSEPGELSVEDKLPRPISPYGMSKVSNEAQAQALFQTGGVPITGLRFFKVYGPWARPDTVFFIFTDRVYRGLPVVLYNQGKIQHSFTYIDDVVDGVFAALGRPPTPETARHPVYNLGNDQSFPLADALSFIEEGLGRKAERELRPLRPGDRSHSQADIQKARRELGFSNKTTLADGVQAFVTWYLEVYVPQLLTPTR